MDVDTPPEANTDNPYNLSLSSMVEVTLATGNTYGIIRWIGNVPDRSETMVGLELVSLYTLSSKAAFCGTMLCKEFCIVGFYLVANVGDQPLV